MQENLKELKVLGIMSGTSLDGLDLALCSFSRNNSHWNYYIIKAETLPYPKDIRDFLESAISLKANELCMLDHYYGKWIGNSAKEFLRKNNLSADLISSHGHTVFHQPAKSYTLQIGNGNDIHATTGIQVVNDFRSMDVALGGNGAPLVPVGDEYLFAEYDICLNLGGFSNLSYKDTSSKRIAFDICPVNMALNYLALKTGVEFDCAGKMGRQGKIIPAILDKLNSIEFYSSHPPKSLGREWFIENIQAILDEKQELDDIMRSLYEHIAIQISKNIENIGAKTVLVSGGGAKNKFLMELLSEKTKSKLVSPSNELIDFKEALIFAFLGYLRVNSIINVFASVTGSRNDHCAGSIVNG